MSSKPSDVLATVFLWVCFCIASLIVLKGLFGDEKPSAPPTALSHNYIEPQAVLPQPLRSFDLPPPRERPEPTFEPRPEPEPLPRRNGLIPRAERRVRPAVPPGRRVQRERPLAEMSTRERVAAAEKEAAKEAHEAQKEQERHWRTKAAAAERKQEATSRTGGERKPLNINMGAADSYPRKTQDVKAERPAYEGSNAFTGTALGGEKGTAYASPMDVDGAGNAAEPIAGEVQVSDDTPADNISKVTGENNAPKQPLTGEAEKSDQARADNTSMAPGENHATNQPLAGEAQEASNVVPGHSSTTAETQSDNPLLKMNDEDAANGLETELSSLQKSQANGEADDSWDRKVLWVYTSWLEWITSGNTLKWNFDKLNEARIQRLKPMVEKVFTALDNRCGKRNHDVPAGALDDTLAVVSVVRDDMNEALDHLQGKNPGRPGTQVQTPSAATGQQSTIEGQSADDERLKQLETSRDQEFAELLQKRQEEEAAQIARDRESAKALDLQQKQRKDARISSDHETAKSLFLQQEQEAALLYQDVYMQDDLVDQQTRTSKRNYPETAVASGSGTYPKNGQASRRIVSQVPDSPVLPPPFKLPRHKVVTLASEQTVAAGPALADGAQESNHAPPSEDATMALDEHTNTSPNSPPANPLLGLQPSEAWATLDSWLDKANLTFSTLTNDDAEEWFQNLKMALTHWSEIMERGGKVLWVPVKGPDVFRLATFASSTRQLIERQFGAATEESVNVCEWMESARNHVEEYEQARINEARQQEEIHMAQLQQQQEQARFNEQERQKSMSMAQAQQQQQQQLAQNAPAEDDEDLYGNDAIGEEQQKARMAERKLARAAAERNATSANETKTKPVQVTEQEFDAGSRMDVEGQNAQSNPAVQQQTTAKAVEPRQQAPASSATTQQSSCAPNGLSGSRWNTSESNTETDRPNVSDNNFEADSRKGGQSQNAQPDAAAQQQHVGELCEPHQQALPAPLANFDALSATGRTTQVEPQTNTANVVAPETKQRSQDEMDTTDMETEPRNMRLDVQNIDLQNSRFSFAVGGVQNKQQDAFNKNLEAENADRKREAERAAFSAGFKTDSGQNDALFVSDDVQKRHKDDLLNDQAKAKADVAAAYKEGIEAPTVAPGTTTTDTISQLPTTALRRNGSDSSLTSFESSSDEDDPQSKPKIAPQQASSSKLVLNFCTGPPQVQVQRKPAPGSDEEAALDREKQAAKCFPPKLPK